MMRWMCLIMMAIVYSRSVMMFFIEVYNNRRMQEDWRAQWSAYSTRTILPLLVTRVVINEHEFKAEICSDGICLNDSELLAWQQQMRVEIAAHEIILIRGEHQLCVGLPDKNGEEWHPVIAPYVNLCFFQRYYTPIKKIGKGTFASVYLVQRNRDGATFAVKAFSKEAAYSEKYGRESLLKEITIMRAVSSKNIMKLQEVYESEGSLYMVFELFQGGRLQDRLQQKRQFANAEIQCIIKGILHGLVDLHCKGVMHRDLKPQNLLFRCLDSSDCCVGDLGLAQFVSAEQYLFVRCGTPGFVAPQIINLKDKLSRYDQSCDLFSLGLLFHLVLFRKGLFDAVNYNQILQNNKACAFDLSAEPYSSLPPHTIDLLRRLLQVDPAKRISAEEALEHTYFKVEVEEIRSQKSISEKSEESIEEYISLSNENIREIVKKKALKKDSCLPFQFSKESVITGHTDTVGNLGSGQRLSGFGLTLLKEVKTSKFTKDKVREEEVIEIHTN